MKLDRWDPLRDMLNFHERLNRIMDPGGEESPYRRPAAWSPSADVFETRDAYVVRAELPGVGKNNINIEAEGTLLTIEGRRLFGSDPGIVAFHSVERVHGVFRRSFRLPGLVDVDKARAQYIDGLLELTLPKASGSIRRSVTIVCVG